jgi:DNA-binding transcriptional regulator YhcF (GntR family)
MLLEIDPAGPVPPYEQIRAQLAALIAGGSLPPGTRLPSIRQLAGDLGIAPGTVARAFRELEQVGLITSRGRHGTRVAEHPPVVEERSHPVHLEEAATTFAVAAVRSGHGLTQALDAVRRAFNQIDRRTRGELGGQT